MTGRLPWFRCFPTPMLGAIAGMQPDEGYVYIVTLLRIYETGGPVAETSRTLARRTGLPERKVAAALKSLTEAGKLQRLLDGRLDSTSTHDEIAWQDDRRDGQSKAGKASAAKRAAKHDDERQLAADEKDQQNQRNGSTSVERPSSHKEQDRNKEKEKESMSLSRSADRPPLGGGRTSPNSRQERRISRRTSAPSGTPAPSYFAEEGTPQLEAWLEAERLSGRSRLFITERNGIRGRFVPSEWPPRHVFQEAAE